MYLLRGICLEGGGSTGVAHIGALEILDNYDILSRLTHFIGSSAGSIAAAALSCRADVAFMHTILMGKDFKQLLDHSLCVCADLARLYRKFGYHKGDALEEWIGEVLKKLTGSAEITFDKAHQMFGTFLEVTVTDLFTGTEYISHLTHPNMMIKSAVRRSSSMPFVFKSESELLDTTFVKNDQITTAKKRHYYTDGGLLDNYPLHRLYQYLPKESIIGIKLMSSYNLHELEYSGISEFSEPPSNIVDFIKIISTIVRNQALRSHVEEEDWKRTIKVDVGVMASTDFNLSDEDKEFLIEQGRIAAKNLLKKYKKPYEPQRIIISSELVDLSLSDGETDTNTEDTEKTEETDETDEE